MKKGIFAKGHLSNRPLLWNLEYKHITVKRLVYCWCSVTKHSGKGSLSGMINIRTKVFISKEIPHNS